MRQTPQETEASAMQRVRDTLAVFPQYVLPQHLLSRFMYRLARSRRPWLVQRLIALLCRHYPIVLDEAEQSDPRAYASLNAFFTRALREGARPLPNDPQIIASPADGAISRHGRLTGEQIIQAKGHRFSVETLLGLDGPAALPFRDGDFITIYLAPHNYHRVHSPVDCRVMEVLYIPGRLFSVNARTARTVPRLFARNERVVLRCLTDDGKEFALVMVGAMLVGSMELKFCDLHPAYRAHSLRRFLLGDGVALARGEELGRFNMGSTVILLFQRDFIQWNALIDGQRLNLGEGLGRQRENRA